MAIDQQGIMALPEGQQAMMPQLSYSDSYDAMRQALQQVNPEVDAELQQTLNGLRATLTNVSDEELQQLIDAVQTLIDDPEGYARNIAQAVRDGDLEAGVFPEEYDEEFLGSVLSVLLDEQRTRQAGPGMMMPPPQQFARGGIADAARLVASKGRNGDTMLAHITPGEARLLRSRGGSGTINPETGLPEYFLKGLFRGIGKVFSAIGSAVKSVLKSPIGRIVGTIALGALIGPGAGAFGIQGLGLVSSTAAASGIASGVVAGLAGGGLKDILISAGTGFLGAPGGPVSEFIGSKIANPLLRDALVGAGVGTAAGLLQGQKLKDAVKGGLTAGAISGGMSYLQNRGNLQIAKADAEQAAAAKTSPAVTDIAEDITGTATRPTSTPGLFAKTTTYADGRVVEQMVDGRGAPIGPPTPVGAGAPTPASAQAPSPSAAAAPSIAAPSVAASDYLQGLKASTIRENFNIPTPRTVAGISQYDLVPPPSVGLTVDKLSGGIQPNLANFQSPSGGIGNVPMPRTSAQVQAPAPYTVPKISDSLSTMGRGIKELGTGQFSTGAETFMQGAEDLFFPGPSKEQISQYARQNNMTFSEAEKAISPPMLRTYGPGVAAATGIGALAGAFERKELPESEFARGMRAPIDLSGDPRAYYIQDIPGAIYDARGNIIGSRPLPRFMTGYAEGGEVEQPPATDVIVKDAAVRYGETPPPLTLADVRAPAVSYTGYQRRFISPNESVMPVIIGGGNTNTVIGGGGTDTVVGGGGTNTVVGGGGIDTVVGDGGRNIISTDPNAYKYNYFDNSAQDNELIRQFQAGENPKTRADLVEFYTTELGRLPDPAGFNYWLNKFGTEIDPNEMKQLQAGAQAEKAQKEGIASLYKQYGEREYDLPGLEYWMGEAGRAGGVDPIRQRFIAKMQKDIDMANAGYRTFDPNQMGSRMTQEEADMLNARAPYLYGTIPGTISSQYPAGKTNNIAREQLFNLYTQNLGRTTPDQAGFEWWVNKIGQDDYISPEEANQFLAEAKARGETVRNPNVNFLNMGGIASLKQGGYPRRTGQISGPGTETSDSIPAMLSDGEFVMTARAVRGMGNGSRRDGARKMYALMHKLERNAARG